MIPHPDFAGSDFPETAQLGAFRLSMLTAGDVEEDFAEVTRSAAVLKGLFDPQWPDGLTLADNETDLHWHHREFTARRSFAWILRDAGGTYLGCAYFNPVIGARGSGVGVYWIVDRPDRLELLSRFGPLYEDWLRGKIPTGYRLSLESNADL
ncbi:hypothetical protein [uncultured Roseobacter sp.]|uniref:hypothetical protein n=1 Tax=uncultured Roseobacter sp. TaxID=114847 RepID=UPI002601CD13|nr:hypothetical protein [uncultured Roseobacter sp.]